MMEFIIPAWFKEFPPKFRPLSYIGEDEEYKSKMGQSLWEDAIQEAEDNYLQLLKWGWKPEQAREVLPNSLKTEIVCTAPLAEWKHMLKLRTSKAAHPQMRALMEPVLSDLKEELPDLF